MFVASDSFGISGTNISLVTDLGAEQQWLHDIRVVVRPAKLHKIRFQFTNIKYDAESVLTRTIVFNGVTYNIGIPLASEVKWQEYRLGYEFDFISRSRGFVGCHRRGEVERRQSRPGQPALRGADPGARADSGARRHCPRLCAAQRRRHGRVHGLQASRQHRRVRGRQRQLLRGPTSTAR